MKKILIPGIIGIMAFVLSGCIKEDINLDSDSLSKFDRKWNIAGPVANIDLKAADLIGQLSDTIKAHIKTDDDGMLIAQYFNSHEILWDDIVKLENIDVQKDYPVIIPPGMTDPGVALYFEEKIKLNEKSEQRFDSMYVQSSILYLDINFPGEISGVLRITFPEITMNGQALEMVYNSSDPQANIQQDLTGYRVVFSQAVDSSYITMGITPESISTSNTGGIITNFGITLSLQDAVPEIIFGSFGNTEILNQDESSDINLFSELESFDMIDFFDLRVLLEFDNYFGIDYQCIIDNTVVRNTDNGDSLQVVFSGNNTINVESATYSDSIVPTLNSEYFDNTNSNLKEAVFFFPNKVDYRIIANAIEDNSDALHFVTQQNKITGSFDIEVPLWIKCQEYTRMDTAEFVDFSDISDEDTEFIDSISLSFVIENSLPFEVELQVYVLNDSSEIIDSLFSGSQQFLVAGTLDENDIITVPGGPERIDVNLSKNKIQYYSDENVTQMIIFSKTATPAGGTRYVKILDSYGMNIKFSMAVRSDELE